MKVSFDQYVGHVLNDVACCPFYNRFKKILFGVSSSIMYLITL